MQEIQTVDNARARELALEKIRLIERATTSPVGYRSTGRLLIIGEASRALPLAKHLQKNLRCTVLDEHSLAEEGIAVQEEQDRIRVVDARLTDIDGYLGAFSVTADDHGQPANLAQTLGEQDGFFDLVLDLGTPAHIEREVLPPGYYTPGAGRAALERILGELPDLVGEFEKPKYFEYNPDICAHGASGLQGCSKCIDACPTEAIISIGDTIEVSPYLCQGGGSCATACPSGAITFIYPPLSKTLETVRTLARHYREAGGRTPMLLFHDAMLGRHMVEPVRQQIPGHIIPWEIEEIGAVGIEVWLAAMAYGINRTILLTPPSPFERVKHTLQEQMGYATAVIEGIGYSANHITAISVENGENLVKELEALQVEPEIHPATFSPEYEKRTTLRLAIDHLYVHAPKQVPTTPLPVGAPFGEVVVQKEACTLCMACVGVCPTAALSDGHDIPQLRFDEWNCVQCGLCEQACPEEAITRKPRFVYDPVVRRRTRVLNEDQPFCCVACGKPFATQGVMKTISTRLKDHYMFQTPEARRRMQMCEDCRVRDMFKQDADNSPVRR